MNTVNKTSRVLGLAFLLQFVTSFSSGAFLKQALVKGIKESQETRQYLTRANQTI